MNLKQGFQKEVSRREFLRFLGAGTVTLAGLSVFGACSKQSPVSQTANVKAFDETTRKFPFESLGKVFDDDFVLAKGFEAQLILSEGEKINESLRFGFNNDYVAFLPINDSENDALLCVNHEFVKPLFVHKEKVVKKERHHVETEMSTLGMSITRVKKQNGSWQVQKDDALNQVYDGKTSIPFSGKTKILGASTAMGTLQNCSGGVTPWNTVLSCEENYQSNYGESEHLGKGKRKVTKKSSYGWEKYYNNPPEHYGWVVEIDPWKKQAKKLVSLGRYCHEGALVVQAGDGRCVVYSGDDAKGECVYKFVADKPGTLDSGMLYVANVEEGKWIPLDITQQKTLQDHFQDQTEVLTYTRKAAHLLGATPMDRPEGIAQNPINKDIVVALTNNSKRTNFYGSLFAISEKNQDPLSLEFTSKTMLTGGSATGFACPDNLIFDDKGGLWFTSDISGSVIGKPPYTEFGNNALFYVPTSGKEAGKVFKVASAPVDAEITGPCFAPDKKSLFVAVQHPGQLTKSLAKPTSHWPDGGKSLPKSSVVEISGASLDYLIKT